MECELQKKIINDLKRRNWLVIKTIVLSKVGYPDIFAFHDGRTIFIEVKDTNGIVSEIQKFRINELKKEGFNAIAVFSYNEYIDFISNI